MPDTPPPEQRRCVQCKAPKPDDQFLSKRAPGKFVTNCLRCREWLVEYRKNMDPNLRKTYNLRHKFGITFDDFTVMVEKQNGLCAICEQKPGKKGFQVDHCHDTGVIRGLLCFHCNTGLGHFKDNIASLESALLYLRQYQSLSMEAHNGIEFDEQHTFQN